MVQFLVDSIFSAGMSGEETNSIFPRLVNSPVTAVIVTRTQRTAVHSLVIIFLLLVPPVFV